MPGTGANTTQMLIYKMQPTGGAGREGHSRGSGGPPPESLCASVSPSVKCRGYTRSSSPQPWDLEIFFRLDRAGLKDRGERIFSECSGEPWIWGAAPYSSLPCLNLPFSMHTVGLDTFWFIHHIYFHSHFLFILFLCFIVVISD